MFNQQNLHFKDKAALQAKINIGGVIVQTKLDFSHPLSFGINSSSLTLLKDSEIGFEPISSPFIQVAEYAKDTVLSGYLPPEYQSAFSQTPAIIAEPKGKGSIIAMTDNPLFRNTWLASQKIIDNALYFSGVISHGQ